MRYDIILQRLRPRAKWSFVTAFNSGQISRKADGSVTVGQDEPILESYAAIIWNDATELQPTEQECADEWLVITNERELESVHRARVAAYPTIGDQLDMLWHSMDTGETPKAVEWYDTPTRNL
jgi:hypothetical protein